MWQELPELIAACGPDRFLVNIYTNGTLLNEDNLLRFKGAGLDMVCLSLDSGVEDTHDAWRGQPGTFQKVVDAIGLTREAGLLVKLCATIRRGEVFTEGFQRLLELARAQKVPTNFLISTPTGKWRGRTEVLLEDDEIAYLDDLCRRDPLFYRDIHRHFGFSGCKVVDALYITQAGEVLPCPFIHLSLGNVLEEDLNSIFERGTRIPWFRDRPSICLSGEPGPFMDQVMSQTFSAPQLPLRLDEVRGLEAADSGTGDYEHPACHLCGSTDREPVIRVPDYETSNDGLFQVVRCTECGLHYTYPRPTQESLLEHFYPDDYLCYKPMGSAFLHKLRMLIYNLPRYRALAAVTPTPRPRVLDVGCADGKFLSYLQENTDWEVMGVEPNRNIADLGRARGLNIIDSTLEEAGFEEASFDIVTMSHVIEHVPDPLRTLKEVARMLVPGGILQSEQPDLDAPARKIFGRRWWGWHQPRHLSHFTQHTLGRAIEEAGLRIKGRFQCQIRPGGLAWSLEYLLADLGFPRRLRKLFSYNNPVMLALLMPPELCLSLSGHTGFMRVVAEKPRGGL